MASIYVTGGGNSKDARLDSKSAIELGFFEDCAKAHSDSEASSQSRTLDRAFASIKKSVSPITRRLSHTYDNHEGASPKLKKERSRHNSKLFSEDAIQFDSKQGSLSKHARADGVGRSSPVDSAGYGSPAMSGQPPLPGARSPGSHRPSQLDDAIIEQDEANSLSASSTGTLESVSSKGPSQTRLSSSSRKSMEEAVKYISTKLDSSRKMTPPAKARRGSTCEMPPSEMSATSVAGSFESDTKTSAATTETMAGVDTGKPAWTAADRLCVRATIMEAKELPSWPAHIRPRVFVSATCGNGGKVKTKPVGQPQEYGGKDVTRPSWGQTLVLPQIDDVNDMVSIKVYVTTNAAGVAVDSKIGQIKFPVRCIPRLASDTVEGDLDEDVAKGPAVIVSEHDGIVDATVLKQIDTEGCKPVKLWLKLNKPKAKTATLRLQSKNYKSGGWVCVVLSLIPAPIMEDEDDDAGVCGEDEGDPVGTVAPADKGSPLQWIVLDEEFPCSSTKLQRVCFSTNSPLSTKYMAKRNNTEIVTSDWVTTAEGNAQERKIEYMMPANSLVKAAKAYETWKWVPRSPAFSQVDVESSTPDVPYGTTFTTRMRYIVTRVDERRCRLQISAQVNFSKSTMMKSMIENGAQKGIKQAVQDFQETLMPFVVRKRIYGQGAAGATAMADVKTSHVERIVTVMLSYHIPVPGLVMLAATVGFLWLLLLNRRLHAELEHYAVCPAE